MYDEDDLLPLSGLQHLSFCPRQCALIHLEGLWDDNRLTAEGRMLHDRTQSQPAETRGDVRSVRGLRLRSLRLGLVGQADAVEFHRCAPDEADGCLLEGLPGRWRPFPVEHKRGREKPGLCDEVQLCAQGLCLEEMLEVPGPAGAISYHEPRRRHEVTLGAELRAETERVAAALHDLVAARQTPPAHYERKCRGCSLLDLCLPKTAAAQRSARHYLEAALAAGDDTSEV